jgi:hypothetical protein
MADSGIKSDKSSIGILDDQCHELVARALRNTLSTEIAQSTLAQIVDGLPLLSVLEDTHRGLELKSDHPFLTHESLCPGAFEKIKEILSTFKIENLEFDTSVGISAATSQLEFADLTRYAAPPRSPDAATGIRLF